MRRKGVKMAGKKKGKQGKKGTWSAGDVRLLTRLFANHTTAEVAKKLGRNLDNVKKKASRTRLKKSKSYLKSIGRA
jgi:hypothetical protein